MGCASSKSTAKEEAFTPVVADQGHPPKPVEQGPPSAAPAAAVVVSAKQVGGAGKDVPISAAEKAAAALKLVEEGEARKAAAAKPLKRYVETHDVLKALNEGDVAMVKLSWMIEFASEGKPLPRRQDLPAEAIMSVSEWTEIYNSAEKHIREAVLPLMAVSYSWMTAEHPDPEGKQLQGLVTTVKKHKEEYEKHYRDMGVFIDWCALYQEHGGPGRTPEQYASFKRALNKTMDLWYSHQGVVCVSLSDFPAGTPDSIRTYDKRGWTTFELRSAELIKPNKPLVAPEGVDMSQGTWLWDMVISNGRGRKKNLPISPEDFGQRLESVSFTNDADKDVVVLLFTRTAESVMAGMKKQTLAETVWGGDFQMGKLGEAMRLCQSIEELYLSHGRNLTPGQLKNFFDGIADSGALITLKKLYLDQCKCGDDHVGIVADAIAAGQLPALSWLDFTSNPDFGSPGLIKLSKALATGSLPLLKQLMIKNNKIGDEGARELAQTMKLGVVPQLELLSMEACKLTDKGLTYICDAIATDCCLELNEMLFGDGITSAGVKVFAKVLKEGHIRKLHWLDFRGNKSIENEGGIALLEAIAEAQQKKRVPALSCIVITDTALTKTDALVAAGRKVRNGLAQGNPRGLFLPFGY